MSVCNLKASRSSQNAALLIRADELIKERSSEVMPTVLDRIKPLADTAEDLQMTFANEGPPVYPWEPEPVLRQRRVNTGDQ